MVQEEWVAWDFGMTAAYWHCGGLKRQILVGTMTIQEDLYCQLHCIQGRLIKGTMAVWEDGHL